ncbi:hypothetical protein DDE82_002584 [Stemphylium lycopersici]|uniref:Uncharacterized protein n=1 Tax=Stemphylium lycopersici TaxID=183478 RepID=A0A364NCV0_STELY|nr:hypothetical protein TW65_03584 [Stemphylium lycopersici]RAR07922.1 hypothetical protein DDE82_002584 [Stemphylium lycopersici]RAR15086.1 hypothetical protein DDE83_001523 [Stemphylium lycopersici]
MTNHNDSVSIDIDSPTKSAASTRSESPSKSNSGKSDSSSLSYTDDFATLPSSGATSHAHILDLSERVSLKGDALKLQDAIVTTLFQLSPDTLKSFLGPTVNTFKAVFGKKDVQLVIWRKGLEVFVGTFENHTSMKAYRFEHLAGFLIGYDGSWHLKVTASNAYSAPKWPDVWSGKFECHGGVSKMSVEAEEVDMLKRAAILAGVIVESKYWELKADVKTT